MPALVQLHVKRNNHRHLVVQRMHMRHGGTLCNSHIIRPRVQAVARAYAGAYVSATAECGNLCHTEEGEFAAAIGSVIVTAASRAYQVKCTGATAGRAGRHLPHAAAHHVMWLSALQLLLLIRTGPLQYQPTPFFVLRPARFRKACRQPLFQALVALLRQMHYPVSGSPALQPRLVVTITDTPPSCSAPHHFCAHAGYANRVLTNCVVQAQPPHSTSHPWK